ncbi:MAG: hypothetical protein LBG44_02790 [Gemmatimonadota bacterium]|jgi:hypothetical protein|nr:hypothetical protein [Gemmatimonadota bacterium]
MNANISKFSSILICFSVATVLAVIGSLLLDYYNDAEGVYFLAFGVGTVLGFPAVALFDELVNAFAPHWGDGITIVGIGFIVNWIVIGISIDFIRRYW